MKSNKGASMIVLLIIVAILAGVAAVAVFLVKGDNGVITNVRNDGACSAVFPWLCRRDTAKCLLHSHQLQRCMEKAAEGTVLVSARIAKGEQKIMDDVIAKSYPVTLM